MSHARPIHPGKTYFITRRTERRHCLLRPDSAINAFILFALVIAALRYRIMVHAFCGMSTHMHYVITDPRGNLPQFLAMFHRFVAIGVKLIRQWDGAVWNRSQTSVVELCTREAIIEKIAYTLANPVAAGLVRYASEWPGVKTSVEDIGKKSLLARRPAEFFNAKNSRWLSKVKLRVTLPPSIAKSSASAFREAIKRELERLEAMAHANIPKHKVLDAKLVTEVDPESRITSYEPTKQRNPTFAVGRRNTDARKKALDARREFRQRYQNALLEWRSGNRVVVFPAGTYVMRVLHQAVIAT